MGINEQDAVDAVYVEWSTPEQVIAAFLMYIKETYKSGSPESRFISVFQTHFKKWCADKSYKKFNMKWAKTTMDRLGGGKFILEAGWTAGIVCDCIRFPGGGKFYPNGCKAHKID